MLVHIFRGPGSVFGFTEDGTGEPPGTVCALERIQVVRSGERWRTQPEFQYG